MSRLMSLFFSLLFTINSTSWNKKAILAVNVLVRGPYADPNTMNITAKQYLRASNFYLVMQPDCNLVTYNGSTPFLTTGSSPKGPSSTWHCYCTLQTDGNFVMYQKPNDTSANRKGWAIWATETLAYGFNKSTYRYLILQVDGSLGMYEPDGTALTTMKLAFTPVNASSTTSQNASSNLVYPFPPESAWKPTLPLDGYPCMPAGYFLSQGSRLITADGRFTLLLGHDCKLQSQEIWNHNNTVKRVIWEGMAGVVSGSCQLTLQQDGHLEVHDNVSGVMYWNGSRNGDDSVSWVLKLNADDGHVSVSDILNSSNILWSSDEKALKGQRGDATVWPTVVGVIGGVLFVAMAALGLWYRFCRPRLSLNPVEKAFQRRLLGIGGRSRVLSEAKIKQATNNFQHRIGYGGFGDVFYGKLEDGQEIASKVLSSGSHQSKEEFYNEIELLSMVHYKYLVTLIGYSFTPQHQILIYEFMSGGDLRHRLSQGSDSAGNKCAGNKCAGNSVAESSLTWRQRTSITLQVAEGIEYLHDRCTPAIIHRDIKSNNILLTKELVAKVADFGLSKLRTIDQENASHITTVVKGTPGYLDPEYHKTGLLTEKSDVYAFGIVLMEILTGQQQMHIAEKVFEARRSEKLAVLVDPNLEGDYKRDEFVNLVDLSLWCVRKNSGNRPFMRQVVQRLREILVAPLESSAQPKVVESKDDQKHDIESQNSEDMTSNDTVPFSGFSTGNINPGTWRLDQFGDSSFSQMLDHSSSRSSSGNPEIRS